MKINWFNLIAFLTCLAFIGLMLTYAIMADKAMGL